jgi:hypothetical protein
MVSEKKSIKEELQEEEEQEEILPEEAQTQKVELTEEAQSDEIVLPFSRENIKNYLWHVIIIKKVEIRDVVLKKTNQPAQISYIDGYAISDSKLEERLIETLKDQQTIPIDLVKEINKAKREIYLYSSSQGVYYSLMRNIIPKLKSGAVIVGVVYQQSDYPQPTITLEHPAKIPALKAQFEAMEKAKR